MKRILLAGLALVAVGLLGFWVWRVFFPGDETLIRELLVEVAEAASVHARDGALVKLGGATKLAGFCTQDVVINVDAPGVGARTINGREELIQTATAARAGVQEVKVKLFDTQLTVDFDGETATAHFTALANVDGSSDPIVQELQMKLRKVEGKWKIAQVEPVKRRML